MRRKSRKGRDGNQEQAEPGAVCTPVLAQLRLVSQQSKPEAGRPSKLVVGFCCLCVGSGHSPWLKELLSCYHLLKFREVFGGADF